MADSLPNSFMGAMKHFFGFKEGQKLTDFAAEMKALNENEKAYFTEELKKMGYPLA